MSKSSSVYAHLKKGKTITSWEAFEMFRATRLADIIFKLRCKGEKIETILVDNGTTRYAKYRMTK
jgi:hypothetical protein